MTRRWAAASTALVFALLSALLSACTAGVATSEPAAASASPTIPAASPSASVASDVLGFWHRAQTCEELLVAFEAAGLAESHAGWLQGNFYGGEPGPTSGDLCAGAQGPLEHSHWFTADGEFGSHDQNGEVVDGGDYLAVDADTLSFPSHSTEFGYDGDILVDYSVADDVATFDVVIPESCEGACQDAYAWALSAFASGPWETGDVP